VIVDRCFSKNPRHEHVSISAQGKTSGISKNCRVTNCSFTGTNDATEFPGETFVSTLNVEDVIIANNICDTTSKITSGITPNGRRTIVANNILRNTSGPGIILSQIPEAEYDASGSVIVGNLIENSQRYAIMVGAYAIRDVIISNNIVNGVNETTYGGIYVGGAHQNIVVTSNIVHDCGGSGIIVHGTPAVPAKRVKISDNICYNNGVSLSNRDDARSGIRVSGSAVGSVMAVNIQDNICFDDQNKKTQKYGIRLTNTNDTIVRSNEVRNNLISGVSREDDIGTILVDNIS
jgi:parallel beta-helix repeat protein